MRVKVLNEGKLPDWKAYHYAPLNLAVKILESGYFKASEVIELSADRFIGFELKLDNSLKVF